VQQLTSLSTAECSHPLACHASDDLRQAVGAGTLVPQLTQDVSAHELLDRRALLIEGEPARFAPDDSIGAPERNPHSVWR
jgi:hypothetical protein